MEQALEEDIPLLAPVLAAHDGDMLLHLEEEEDEEVNKESLPLPLSPSSTKGTLLEEVKTTPHTALIEDMTREEEEFLPLPLPSTQTVLLEEVKTTPHTALIEDMTRQEEESLPLSSSTQAELVKTVEDMTPSISIKLIEEVKSRESPEDAEETLTRPHIEAVTSGEGDGVQDAAIPVADVPLVDIATFSEDLCVQDVSKQMQTSPKTSPPIESVEVVELLPSAEVEERSSGEANSEVQQIPNTEVQRPLIQVVTTAKDPELNTAVQGDSGDTVDSSEVSGHKSTSNPVLGTSTAQSITKPTIEVALSCQDNAELLALSSGEQDESGSKQADRSDIWVRPKQDPASEKEFKLKQEAPPMVDQDPGFKLGSSDAFRPAIEVISSVSSLDNVSTLVTEQPEHVVNSIMKKPGEKRGSGKPKAVRFPDAADEAALQEEREYFPQNDEHTIPWYESDSNVPQWAAIQSGGIGAAWATMVSHDQHREGVARSSSDEMVVEQIEDELYGSTPLLVEQQISNSPTVRVLEPPPLAEVLELSAPPLHDLQLVGSSPHPESLPTLDPPPLDSHSVSQSLPTPTSSLQSSDPPLEATVPQHPDQESSEFKLSDVPLVDAGIIQKVDDALRNIEGKPAAELTQEERVWQLAASAGSTLEGEAIDLDAQTKARLRHTIEEVGGEDKVSLKF